MQSPVRPTRIYLETSALNYFYSLAPNINDARATQAVQHMKGNSLYLSPVTLWEVLLISDATLREEMLAYCAALCESMLPKTPAELLLDYVVSRGQGGAYDDFSTTSALKTVWANMHRDPMRTIAVDHADLQLFSNNIKRQSKSLDSIITNFIFDGQPISGEKQGLNVLVSTMFTLIDFPNKKAPPEHNVARRIAILIVFLVLCEGIDIAHDLVTAYWQKAGGIEHPFERMEYLVARHPYLFYSGPVTFMAAIVAFQHSKGKTNRGAIHDGLHCGYLPYFDLFLTNDGLLVEMATVARPDFQEVYDRIVDISKLPYTLRKVNTPSKDLFS